MCNVISHFIFQFEIFAETEGPSAGKSQQEEKGEMMEVEEEEMDNEEETVAGPAHQWRRGIHFEDRQDEPESKNTCA